MDELQGNGFREGGGEDEEETDDAEGRRQTCETDDFGCHGCDGAPEGAARCAREEGKGEEHAVCLCGDPHGQTQQATEEGHDGRHVDPTEGVAVVSYDRTTDSEAEVEEGADDGALRWGEVDGRGVVG